MPKDDRGRTLAVRDIMTTTGLRYTQAARLLDAHLGRSDAGAVGELSSVPFTLSVTVPAEADPQKLAQRLADRLHTLLRPGASCQPYAVIAEISVPSTWKAGDVAAVSVRTPLVIRIWAVRPWREVGEADAVVADCVRTAAAWLSEHFPGAQPTFHALSEGQAADLTENAVPAVRTSSAHVVRPLGRLGRPDEAATDKGFGFRSGPPSGNRPASRPDHVVDSVFQSWRRGLDGFYYCDQGVEPLTYGRLDQLRAPLRPVGPPAAEERAQVIEVLSRAGQQAAASTLVAMYEVVEWIDRGDQMRVAGLDTQVFAAAGNSPQARTFQHLARTLGATLAQRRRRRQERYDDEVVHVLTYTVQEWVTGLYRYVEPASSLAALFGEVADATGGWAAVADRYLQPGSIVGHRDDLIEEARRYLLGQPSQA
ncbi:hypothetical protein [Streptomyces sp. NPDC058268]|uniref:hypothetical protein n=1 Tax=Streptomyces sp. NPDC058268 TaxID=3346413 RepID=UPI0036E8F3BC